jgi:hypothetical protein
MPTMIHIARRPAVGRQSALESHAVKLAHTQIVCGVGGGGRRTTHTSRSEVRNQHTQLCALISCNSRERRRPPPPTRPRPPLFSISTMGNTLKWKILSAPEQSRFKNTRQILHSWPAINEGQIASKTSRSHNATMNPVLSFYNLLHVQINTIH